MARSKSRAKESRYEAKRVIFYFFQPRSKTGAEPGHVKSKYGENGLSSIIFCPSPRLRHVKVGTGQMVYFLLISVSNS